MSTISGINNKLGGFIQNSLGKAMFAIADCYHVFPRPKPQPHANSLTGLAAPQWSGPDPVRDVSHLAAGPDFFQMVACTIGPLNPI